VTQLLDLGKERGKALNRRRAITVDLPEFAIRAIEWRVEEANADDGGQSEEVTFNDVVEWLLVCELSVRRMPFLEQSIPGFTAAMFTWLMEATYLPDED
jgi:hypothetical protein